MALSIRGLIEANAAKAPSSTALGAPGRDSLDYAGLLSLMDAIAGELFALGVERGDAVALVLPIDRAYWMALKRARLRYEPEEYDGSMVMFLTPDETRRPGSGFGLRWGKYAARGAEAHRIDCRHSEMLHEPYVGEIAGKLKAYLDKAPGK